MIDLLITYVVAFGVSAFGTIPPGTINLLVMRKAIVDSKKAAFIFAAITAVMEIIHIFIAIKFASFINSSTIVRHYFQFATVVFLLVIAIAGWFQKARKEQQAPVDGGIKQALAISIMNPFSIPFWVVFVSYMITEKWIPMDFSIPTFLIGACMGTFLTFTIYVVAGGYIEKKGILRKINLDKWLAVMFFGMALYKIWGLVIGQ